jgi:hypothetical protein
LEGETCEPTIEEVELREIYTSWIDLHAATKNNLRDFERDGFQLPKKAVGHEEVKRLVCLETIYKL